MIEVPRQFFYKYLKGFKGAIDGWKDVSNDRLWFTSKNRDIAYSTSMDIPLNRKYYIPKHIRVS